MARGATPWKGAAPVQDRGYFFSRSRISSSSTSLRGGGGGGASGAGFFSLLMPFSAMKITNAMIRKSNTVCRLTLIRLIPPLSTTSV